MKYLYSLNSFYVLAIFNVAIVVTFGNFLPVGEKVFSNSFGQKNEAYFSNLASKPEKLIEKKKRVFEQNQTYRIGEQFLFSPTHGDSIAYMDMALGNSTKAPYKFRIFYPKLINMAISLESCILRNLSNSLYERFSNNPYRVAQLNFWVFNFICLLVTCFILTKVAGEFTSNRSLVLIYIVLFITQCSVLETVSYPLLDVFSYFIFSLGFLLLIKEKYLLLAIVLALSVATKESLVIWGVALFLMYFERKEKKLLFLSIVPFITFVLIRLVSGDDPLSIQSGWDFSQGEFRLDYLKRHLESIREIVRQFLMMFFAFGILWLYLPKLNVLSSYRLKWFFVGFLGSLIIAQILLSSGIARVISPIFPVFALIPLIMFSSGTDLPNKLAKRTR